MAREFVLEIIVALKGLKIKYNGGIYEWETLPYFYILLNHMYPLICLLIFLNSHKGGQVRVKGGLPPSFFNKEI